MYDEIVEICSIFCLISPICFAYTVKPVCNDHLYNKIYQLWYIQYCVLMMTEGTNLLLLTISAFWSSSRWRLATYYRWAPEGREVSH